MSAIDREAVIEATRREWRSGCFIWGQADCFMSCFNFARILTGIDGGAEWRGTYHDEAGALAVLGRAGGGLAGFARGMQKVGAEKVTPAARGDLVVATYDAHQIGGLCLGETMAFRLERGAVEVDRRFVHVLGAWRP